jgi:hypothetical protein
LGESCSGKLFFYMLYYLQFGTLPGGKTYAKCLLDIATLGELKKEAGYYELKELETLCERGFGSLQRVWIGR